MAKAQEGKDMAREDFSRGGYLPPHIAREVEASTSPLAGLYPDAWLDAPVPGDGRTLGSILGDRKAVSPAGYAAHQRWLRSALGRVEIERRGPSLLTRAFRWLRG